MSLNQERHREAQIKFSSEIDFTKGFSSWYIRWPIKSTLASANPWIVSSKFETAIQSRTRIKWYLGIKKDDESMFFGLYPGQRLPAPTAVILRLALRNEDNGSLLFNKACYYVYFDSSIVCGTSIDLEKAKSFVGDHLVFHCWMDFPIDVQPKSFNVADTLSFHSETAIDFLNDLSELFDGVVKNDEESKLLSDIILIVLNESGNEVRRFYCHRIILASRSPVFETMFANKEWKESAANKDERFVEIKDIEATTLEYVLRFIYTGHLYPNGDPNLKLLLTPILIKIMYVAEKYFLTKLKELCVSYLICFKESDARRAQEILVVDQYRLPQLKAVCLAALSSNFEPVKSEYNIPHELLTEINAASAKRRIEMKDICVEEKNIFKVNFINKY